jgi:hypothetical protein
MDSQPNTPTVASFCNHELESLACGISAISTYCHEQARSAGWWNDIHTGESLIGKRNRSELLLLAVSELIEANEGFRKNIMDDHLPHRKMAEVELADAFIRICDLAESEGYDLGNAVVEKLVYNANRPDHKRENRLKDDGKKF